MPASHASPDPRPARPSGAPSGSERAALIADTALALLTERGMRGLTHRAVDAAAGLPQGSTSNHARTRQALLEVANHRLAEREARVLRVRELTDPAGGVETVAEGVAQALHRYLTHHRDLLVCRYELALEATRRPALRQVFDDTGRQFREPLLALVSALGSPDPARHARALIAWAEGMMFSYAAGSAHSRSVSLEELRAGCRELLAGMTAR
ncbi:TetR/AcrR family transcriptional regulator [Streptomyces sp. NPDC058171]